MTRNVTTTNLRNRPALLLLPLLLVPFLTLGFWALGGGTSSTVRKTTTSGLNLELPNASLKNDATESKLGFYEQAEQNAAKRKAQQESDPLYQLSFSPDSTQKAGSHSALWYDPVPQSASGYSDPNEEKVYRKLAQLNEQLQQTTAPTTASKEAAELHTAKPKMAATDNGGLEQMEHLLAQSEGAESNDPDLQQLNGLLDKVRAIQQPAGIEKSPVALHSGQGNSYSVSDRPLQASVSLLDSLAAPWNTSCAFYGLWARQEIASENAIQAVVHQSQVVTAGGVLKLRLLQPLTLRDVRVPQGTLVYGTTAWSGERLLVTISSIQYHKSLFPVHLEAYDLDGLPGLYVPGAGSESASLQRANNSLQVLQMSALDPSLKAQAVTTGISALKALLSKKQKQAKVAVKGGYRLLLKNKTA